MLLRIAAALVLFAPASAFAQAAADPLAFLPEANRTTWRPGIPGGVPRATIVHATIDGAKYGDGKADAAAAINAAIQSAGDAARATGALQVVFLPDGTYRIGSSVVLDRSRVVLRGAGPERTRIRLDSPDPDAPAIRFGRFWPVYQERAWDVIASVPKGGRELVVAAADAADIRPGDVLQIDQEDADYVWFLDGRYRKRQPESDMNGPGTKAAPFRSVDTPGGPWRSVGQQVEVAAVRVYEQTATIELVAPVHVAFEAAQKPQIFHTATARAGHPGVRGSGIEDLYVTGGNRDNVTTANLAYAWIANIESDGDPRTVLAGSFQTPGGMHGQHVNLLHAYRCVVRDSYFHHARSINPGGGAYGISVANASSDNLVENNVAVHLNKPIVMNNSGGGNVIAYNYADDAYIADSPGWQESAIDGNHETFSHHDLFEGNWSVNLGSDSTNGNAGWQTFFRNFASGVNSSPPAPDQRNVRAVGVDGFNRGHVFVGNVLMEKPLQIRGYLPAYECTARRLCMNAAAVYRLGANVREYDAFDDGTARRETFRHGNWDAVSQKVVWDPDVTARELPPSLYLREKPAFFGTHRWPWVEPAGERRVYVLPAKERYEQRSRRALAAGD